MIFIGFITGKQRDCITVSKNDNIIAINKSEYENSDLYDFVENVIISAKSSNFRMTNFKNSNDTVLEVNLESTKEMDLGQYKEFDFGAFQPTTQEKLVSFFDTINGLNG